MHYLYSPAFAYTEKFLDKLREHADTEAQRVLVYPVANGLRLRTLNHNKHAIIEVSGAMVYIDWEENHEVNDMVVPYKGTRSVYCVASISDAVEKVHGFFNGTWKIETDL